MEPIGFVIICEADFHDPAPTSAPLIPTLEAARAEAIRIEGTPGAALRCFSNHLIVQVYSRETS